MKQDLNGDLSIFLWFSGEAKPFAPSNNLTIVHGSKEKRLKDIDVKRTLNFIRGRAHLERNREAKRTDT